MNLATMVSYDAAGRHLRGTARLLGIFGALLLSASVAGQVIVVSDQSGDVAFGPEGAPGGLPGPWDVDITEIAVAESDQEFSVAVKLAPVQQPGLAPGSIDVYFAIADSTFWIQYLAPDSVGGSGALYRQESTGWVLLDAIIVTTQDGTWTAGVPRILLVSSTGSPPAPGDELTKFWASARAAEGNAGFGNVGFQDRAPDEGDVGVFAVTLGPEPIGGARLFSPSPSRVSNGEEATFVYPIVLQNNAEKARDFILEVARQPSTWTVDLPFDVLRLEAGESVSSVAFVSTPFAHQHGRLETVELLARSIDGQASAPASLYLLYHAIPQPSGHHNTLYLHASDADQSIVNQAVLNDGGQFSYMNTIEEDDLDSGTGVLGRAASLSGTRYVWEFVLHPVLKAGLDFDVTGQGQLRIQLNSPMPVVDGEFTGQLVIDGENPVVLATVGAASNVALNPGTPVTLELTVTPTPEADFVPFNGSLPVVLELALESGRPATYSVPESPKIMPGSSVVLPLLEYRDELEVQALQLPAETLAVEGDAQKQVKPGGKAVFPLRSLNGADQYDVIGTNLDWVTLLSGDERADAYVIVTVPSNAGNLQIVDAIVKASRDGQLMGLSRVLVTVSNDGVDESSEADRLNAATGKQETPAFHGALLGGVIVAVALISRRR